MVSICQKHRYSNRRIRFLLNLFLLSKSANFFIDFFELKYTENVLKIIFWPKLHHIWYEIVWRLSCYSNHYPNGMPYIRHQLSSHTIQKKQRNPVIQSSLRHGFPIPLRVSLFPPARKGTGGNGNDFWNTGRVRESLSGFQTRKIPVMYEIVETIVTLVKRLLLKSDANVLTDLMQCF